MNQKTKSLIKSSLIVVLFSLSVSAIATWTSPTSTPTGDNVATPFNTGSNPQIKTGAAVFYSERVTGLTMLDGRVEIGGPVSIGTPAGGGATTDSSALFQLNSTTKGFMLPRMTNAQRNAISAPVTGLMVFQTDSVAGSSAGLKIFNGAVWSSLTETPEVSR